MTMLGDPKMRELLAALVVLLAAATIAGSVLRRRARTDSARASAENLVARTRAWWVMATVFIGAGIAGAGAASILFALISFLALREMITLSPTRHGDHHTLFSVFFIATPISTCSCICDGTGCSRSSSRCMHFCGFALAVHLPKTTRTTWSAWLKYTSP